MEKLAEKVAAQDWTRIIADLDRQGWSVAPALLPEEACVALRESYDKDRLFRSRVVMDRHGFGSGEYKYFAHPLPDAITEIRVAAYSCLHAVASRWNAAMGINLRYPAELGTWLARCHAAGQRRPTPLLLRYGLGDYNCLHQDLYGEHVFPLQMAILLSRPGTEFSGGELVLTEQRPRMQSRPHVLDLRCGDAAIFAVRHRPVAGVRGTYRTTLRHGVSMVRTGERFVAGIIFHDAA